MRALRAVAIAFGGLVVLLILLLLAVKLFVNPNDYKGRITEMVKHSTGRDLALPGEIKLSVFPWIALELGPASLGNPPGFPAEPFASVQHVAARVRVLPLLRKQLEIGHVQIDGLDLRLRKNAAGHGNWEVGAQSTSATPTSGHATALPDLAGVSVRDGRLQFQDLLAEHVNLDVGHLTPGTPVPIDLKLDLKTRPTSPPISLAGKLNVTLDPSRQVYRLSALDLRGTTRTVSTGKDIPWSLTAPAATLDMGTERLSLEGFAAQLAGASLTGAAQASALTSEPSLQATFQLAPLDARALLARLGMAQPVTRDPKAFSTVAASGTLAYGANAAGVSRLDLQLDDSHVKGRAGLANLRTGAIDFDLTLDRINLDRYRSPEKTLAPAPSPQTKPAAKTAQPLSALRTLEMKGTLAIGALTLSGLNVSQVRVGVEAAGGITHIAPATARMYGGDYAGNITLDDRSGTPAMQLDQSLSGVDVAQLLQDFAKTRRLSGHGTITTHLNARGIESDALMHSLSGHVAANLADGAVEGMDLWFQINRALALAQQKPLPAGTDSGRTRFDAFKATADLTNGVASTKDLSIASQNLRIAGQGTYNLVTNAIDYRVNATVLKQAPGAAQTTAAGTLAQIPINVTGTLTRPTVRPDLEALAKNRLQQELDKHKGELQQKLQDKLKGLFK